MKYYYNMADTFSGPRGDYWTEEEVRAIRIYPATPKVVAAAELPDSCLWPVHSIDGWSWEAVDCKDIEEAYEHLGRSLNMSIYEYLHDI